MSSVGGTMAHDTALTTYAVVKGGAQEVNGRAHVICVCSGLQQSSCVHL